MNEIRIPVDLFDDVSVDRCHSSALVQYYGPRCVSLRWGAGFYGALFGSLAAALLLLAAVGGIVWFKKRRCYSW